MSDARNSGSAACSRPTGALANARALAGSLALAGALALTAGPAPAQQRSFTDDAGRTVQLPQRIYSVYPTGHPASILLYSLAPEWPFGWFDRPPCRVVDWYGRRGRNPEPLSYKLGALTA